VFKKAVDACKDLHVTGERHGLELRSAATGQLLKRVATIGESFTGNGLAISPDGSAVYATVIGHQHSRTPDT
jgi:hypothetical protein